MNIYKLLSEKIGHDGVAEYPTKEEALSIYRDVAYEESPEAFEKAFRFYRYLNTAPQTDEQRMIFHIITEAYLEGRKLFDRDIKDIEREPEHTTSL